MAWCLPVAPRTAGRKAHPGTRGQEIPESVASSVRAGAGGDPRLPSRKDKIGACVPRSQRDEHAWDDPAWGERSAHGRVFEGRDSPLGRAGRCPPRPISPSRSLGWIPVDAVGAEFRGPGPIPGSHSRTLSRRGSTGRARRGLSGVRAGPRPVPRGRKRGRMRRAAMGWAWVPARYQLPLLAPGEVYGPGRWVSGAAAGGV